MDVSWAEILWGAISVGKSGIFDMVKHGHFSYFEILYRAAIIFANLYEDENGHLRRSSAYDNLDPSEKAAISYFLGLTFTKIFSSNFLNVSWLMHLDVYRYSIRPILKGQSKPDLVGQDESGNWVIMESKGRTNKFDSLALRKAKKQAVQVIKVSGSRPILHVGLQVHFDNGLLQLNAVDPKPENDKNKIELLISKKQFFWEYYRRFYLLFNEAKNVKDFIWRGEYKVQMLNIHDVDISVGLEKSLFDLNMPEVRKFRQLSDDNAFFGPDGIFIQVGSLWSKKNMRKQPQNRSINLL